MRHLVFSLRQAIRNLAGDRQRTLFVLFSIAIGVAAVVSLRNVGLMIEDGLVRNLRADNRADLVISVPPLGPGFDNEIDSSLVDPGGDHTPSRFSPAGLERIVTWATARGYRSSLAVRSSEPSSVFLAGDDSTTATSIAYFVEPDQYPIHGRLDFVEPVDTTLAAALADPRSVVITDRLAAELELEVGDDLEIRGPHPFRVTAVLDSGSDARMREMEAVLLPYVLMSYEAGRELGLIADTVYIGVPDSAEVTAVEDDLLAEIPGLSVMTTDDLREQNQELSTMLTKLVTTLGLVALLIGGIGIVNTMLVVVGRRTLEIGVLKTIGLSGGRITFMFLAEALVVGIAGSALGVGLGIGLVTILQRVAEGVVAQSLELRLFPEAMAMGFGTGVLVTLVFGFLPTLSAGRVRPKVVLQPERTGIPRNGVVLSTVVIAGLTALMALPVGRILDDTRLGFAIAFGAVAVLGLATGIFWLAVRLLGRLPAPRNPSLRLAQRAACAHPGRTASTLLALVVGMFSLSSILLMTGTLLNVVEDVLEEQVGGDLIVAPNTAEAAIAAEAVMAEMDEVVGYEHDTIYRVELVAINGERGLEPILDRAYEVGRAEQAEKDGGSEPEEETASAEHGDEVEFDVVRYRLQRFTEKLDISRVAEVRDGYEIGTGEDVSPGDAAAIVVRESAATRWLELGPGDRLTFAYPDGPELTATISGVVPEPAEDEFNVRIGDLATLVASDDLVPSTAVALPTAYIVDTVEGEEHAAIRALSTVDGIFVLEVTVINRLLAGIFEKLTALPLVIAILSLFASCVIIANTVTLAVLERRREIGVMKAIGLQSRDVLRLLLLENGLVGLVGGLLGCSLGATGILLLGILSESPGSFPFGTMGLLVALAIAIAVSATLLTAWRATREKPLVVLRYE